MNSTDFWRFEMPQNYPFRLRVLQQLTKSLALIHPSRGFQCDLSNAVFRGRIEYGENDPLPMLSILEPPLPPDPIHTPQRGEEQIGMWDLLLQGFVQDDPRNPTDPAHILLADVRKMLTLIRREDPNILGEEKGIREIHLGSPVVRPADEISSKAYFYLPIRLSIGENLADPYL
jgi:hypothetical protein